MDIILKRCEHCKQKKELECFNKNKSRKDGYADCCKNCRKEENKKYYKPRKETLKKRLSKHNITPEVYNDMFDKQEGKCPICGRHQTELKKGLCVDHDHLTGKKRGLLCTKCNLRLGTFNDNIEDLKRAIIYLEKYKK
jgi:hypothetical protein